MMSLSSVFQERFHQISLNQLTSGAVAVSLVWASLGCAFSAGEGPGGPSGREYL